MYYNTIGVNITSPEKGNSIPVNSNLTVRGKSTDTSAAADDCQISVIVNSIKQLKPVITIPIAWSVNRAIYWLGNRIA